MEPEGSLPHSQELMFVHSAHIEHSTVWIVPLSVLVPCRCNHYRQAFLLAGTYWKSIHILYLRRAVSGTVAGFEVGRP
jgi:hypothetical protein